MTGYKSRFKLGDKPPTLVLPPDYRLPTAASAVQTPAQSEEEKRGRSKTRAKTAQAVTFAEDSPGTYSQQIYHRC